MFFGHGRVSELRDHALHVPATCIGYRGGYAQENQAFLLRPKTDGDLRRTKLVESLVSELGRKSRVFLEAECRNMEKLPF